MKTLAFLFLLLCSCFATDEVIYQRELVVHETCGGFYAPQWSITRGPCHCTDSKWICRGHR